MVEDAPWPLSATITCYLVDWVEPHQHMVKHAFTELVLWGYWTVEHDANRQLLVRPTHKLRHTATPVPLLKFDEIFRHCAPDGGTVGDVIRGFGQPERDAVEDDMNAELARLGLVELRMPRITMRTRPVPYKTKLGRARVKAFRSRFKAARKHPQQTDPRLLGGLVVLLRQSSRSELGRELDRSYGGDDQVMKGLELEDLDESVEGLIDELGHAFEGGHGTDGGGHDGGGGHDAYW